MEAKRDVIFIDCTSDDEESAGEINNKRLRTERKVSENCDPNYLDQIFLNNGRSKTSPGLPQGRETPFRASGVTSISSTVESAEFVVQLSLDDQEEDYPDENVGDNVATSAFGSQCTHGGEETNGDNTNAVSAIYNSRGNVPSEAGKVRTGLATLVSGTPEHNVPLLTRLTTKLQKSGIRVATQLQNYAGEYSKTKGTIRAHFDIVDGSEGCHNVFGAPVIAKRAKSANASVNLGTNEGHGHRENNLGDSTKSSQTSMTKRVKQQPAVVQKPAFEAVSENDFTCLEKLLIAVICGNSEDWVALSESKHIIAQAVIAVCYADQNVLSVKNSPALAARHGEKCLKRLQYHAKNGCKYCSYLLGEFYFFGITVEPNALTAVKLFRFSAKKRVVSALFKLGICHDFGIGLSKDSTKSAFFYGLAAAQGHPCAQNYLACTLEGSSDPAAIVEKVTLYRKAAEAGYPAALSNLGKHFLNSINPDYREAEKLLHLAAEDGHAAAKFELGRMHMLNIAEVSNKAKGKKLILRAAEQGNSEAQYFLGADPALCKDDTEAVSWLRQSACSGHPKALYALSSCYKQGKNVVQCTDEYLRLLSMAATNGHSVAQCELGQCYLYGTGTAVNQGQAVRWLREAAVRSCTTSLQILTQMGVSVF
jgi:TPR repeat protein